ncbi:MAG TPA: agmatine deiminase [Thermoleophilia bacterium]|nr:agmatine deiminase [Thermoleophilia bacterium]
MSEPLTSEPLTSTPRADGYRMPAEFEPHAQTWLLWPQRPDNWRLDAGPAQRAWVEVARALATFEPVTVGANPDQLANARALLPPEVRVVEIANDDAWMRDCGPTFVVNDRGGVRLVDWLFNAWGGEYDGLYSSWDADQLVPRRVAELTGVERYAAPLVMEGGSIHVDGRGTVLTTEECLLSPGRNPQLDRAAIEAHLRDYLNVETVVWLARGIDPDETNGHVDDVACFIAPGEVLAGVTDDRDDWRHDLLQDNLARLRAATDARGRRLSVHTIPMPAMSALTADEAAGIATVPGTTPRRAGDPVAATYLNFALCNGGVVMPVFDDPTDEAARDTLARLFPGRRVLTVPGREILLGGGNVHCITQQQPAGHPAGDRDEPAGRAAAGAVGDPTDSDQGKVS